MSHFFVAAIIILFLVLWGRIAGRAAARKATPRKNIWSQPPPTLSQASRIESLGLTSLVQQRNATDISPNPKTEVHMNPISAVIFVIFIGGAVLSRLANMPIGVTIGLALIGIFLGYSVKMAQQWERAPGQAACGEGSRPLHPDPDLRRGGDLD
jgi:hypothetical protein